MTDKKLNISELFLSIQGEGRWAGVPSVFVRLAGCDLRCTWCDTPYAWQSQKGKIITISDIVNQVEQFNCNHVVVTGGEPLIARDLPCLLKELKKGGRTITVETSATRFRRIDCDLLSISPKLSNSTPKRSPYTKTHEKNRLNISALRKFIKHHDYQLKFVIQDKTDLPEIEAVLKQLRPLKVEKENIYLMPQARTKQEHRRLGPLVAQMCIEKGYRYSPRLQIQLWSNRRGK